MIIDIKIPSPGESITEVELTNWMVEDGSIVEKDQEIAEVESDKATLPLIAEESGKIEILIKEGETITIGTIACKIDTSIQSNQKEQSDSDSDKEATVSDRQAEAKKTVAKSEKGRQVVETGSRSEVKVTPLAQKLMDENDLSVDDIIRGLKKITRKEVNQVINLKMGDAVSEISQNEDVTRNEKREKMSNLRKKLSSRLVAVKNETAMLTTFNEVDMSRIINLRKKYQEQFIKTHGIKLGYMSFFTKAVTLALKAFPKINSMIDGDEIVTPEFCDIAIAVQTDKGLMVPVIRNAETLSLAEIEKKIMDLADKARRFRLSIEEMSGGTFTITNGGVFGSMLSTPIINPPQSGILGMHNIVERPVAINSNVEIRPIMYIALSYDHRLIDGRDSVSFLVKIKELLETPESMIFGNDQSPERILLELD